MNELDLRNTRKWYFGSVIFHVILMHVAYFILVNTFDFPEVLRRPPHEMLSLYMAKLTVNRVAYYLFTLTGFTFVGLVILLHYSFKKTGPLLCIGTVFGVLTGVFQSFGFGRWAFLVPTIAEKYQIPDATELSQEVQLQILDAFHNYAGVLIGENLAFVCQGIWTILISVSILRMSGLPRFFGWVGIVIGLLVGGYSLEQFGGIFSVLGIANVAFQIAWLLWILSIGFYFLRVKDKEVQVLKIKDYSVIAVLFFLMILSAYL